MNRVHIQTRGPIRENMTEITVSDDYATDRFTIDYADYVKAENEGDISVMDLIAENAGTGLDILQAAAMNGSPVYLDGADVKADTVQAAFGEKSSKPVA